MLTTIRSQMNGVEVIKSQAHLFRVRKSPAHLFSAAIWSYLAYSWAGLNYMCKAKYKKRGNG